MESVLIDKNLIKYVISKEISELVTIVSMFSHDINDLEENIYVRQHDVLVKLLNNIERSKKSKISLESVYKNISDEEKSTIYNIEIDEKIIHNLRNSEILGIDYYDEEKFMEVLDKEIWELNNTYNLRANDDYNKLLEFLMSIKSSIKSSEDSLVSLTNQYAFFIGHNRDSLSPEYISLYGNKKYKDELFEGILDKYGNKIRENISSKSKTGNKRH